MPVLRFNLRGFWFLFFLACNIWAKVVHIFRKISTDERSGKKTERKATGEVFARAHSRDVRKIPWSESKKRRGHSPGNTFGVFNVNQPVACILPWINWGIVDYMQEGDNREAVHELFCNMQTKFETYVHYPDQYNSTAKYFNILDTPLAQLKCFWNRMPTFSSVAHGGQHDVT